jgi:phosphoribosylamine--glycine ligase
MYYRLGRPPNAGVTIFHAGTEQRSSDIVAVGMGVKCHRPGRMAEAGRAYQAVKKIQWNGAFFRHDIGWRALKR